jgi:hypothetical protein
MYNIKVSYKTGDSFKSWNTTNILDYDWENIEIVKENMQRIKDHYKWCKYDHWETDKKPPKPAFMKELTAESKKYEEFCIPLKKDDGSTFQISVKWTGYFERLQSIEIEVKNFKIEF